MSDWHKRYEAARIEMEEARILWNEAESAMARANARRHRAEREFHRVFQERIDQIESKNHDLRLSVPR